MLTAEVIAHPYDRRAMRVLQDKLRSNPTLSGKLQAMHDSALEEFQLLNLADNTRASAKQFPHLHDLMGGVAANLGIETAPDLFVDTQAEINAMAMGESGNASVVINTALIDSFSETEIAVVVGHELGHVLCGHSFYRIGYESSGTLQTFIEILPGGAAIGLVLQFLLNDWFRKAELTADRVALAATGDLSSVQSTILKLAGGARSDKLGDMNLEAFLEQAEEFRGVLRERLQSGTVRERLEFMVSSLMVQGAVRTHPWPALRFLEITEWANSPHYEAVQDKDWDLAMQYADEESLPPVEGSETNVDDVVGQVKDVGKATIDLFRNRLGKPPT